MSAPATFITVFSTNPAKTPAGFFVEIDNLTIKQYGNANAQNSQSNLKEQNRRVCATCTQDSVGSHKDKRMGKTQRIQK